ncbi:MAG: TetR family transcriptional regulator [uncultured bacterium]|nr:MAG: TetR family transcriptional regulator [uncultured bacterium]HBG18972.1 TetR family transcriptional regulator [Desulfobulbaceae bacterium]
MQTAKLPAEERRTITVKAVIKLAGMQNPSEITTAAIAQYMKLTQGALFRHFATKDEIWQTVMEWVKSQFLVQIDQTERTIADPLTALEVMFVRHIDFVTQYPGVPRILFGELQKSKWTPAKGAAQSLIKQYTERLCALIEQGKALGEISDDVDTKDAAVLFIGTIQGLIMQSILSGDIQRIQTDASGVFKIYLRGIRSWK